MGDTVDIFDELNRKLYQSLRLSSPRRSRYQKWKSTIILDTDALDNLLLLIVELHVNEVSLENHAIQVSLLFAVCFSGEEH